MERQLAFMETQLQHEQRKVWKQLNAIRAEQAAQGSGSGGLPLALAKRPGWRLWAPAPAEGGLSLWPRGPGSGGSGVLRA